MHWTAGIALASLCALLGCTGRSERELARGNEAARSGRLPEARAAYEAAVKAAPGDARAHALLGNAFAALGRSTEASAQWETALQLDARQTDAVLGLARAALDAGDPDAALTRLATLPSETLATHPSARLVHARALLGRGGAHDAELALLDAEQLLVRLPADPAAAYLKGSALLALERSGDARAVFEDLSRTSPRSPLGPYGLARLAAAEANQDAALSHLRDAKRAAGADWAGMRVARDPAFAFLSTAQDFKELTEP